MDASKSEAHETKAGDLLSGLEFFGMKPGLERTRELMRLAGNPDAKLKLLHIAGSNGKGSVGALLDSALRKAGFKTGFYSSPHLVDVRERFRVNGALPGEKAFASLMEAARGPVETLRKSGDGPSYFEVSTLLAALHFARENVDFAVWETGLGGRLDATNASDALCSIISSISLEHADRLGGTLAKIAYEKAGIIKPGKPVFCAWLPEEALAVVKARAAELGSPLTMPSKAALTAKPSLAPSRDSLLVQSFELDGRTLRVSLPGAPQRSNAALCVKVLEWLSSRFSFDLDKALEGFACAKWPARLQYVPELRTIIDGAHNPEAANALAASLNEAFPGERFQVVAGSFSDKDSGAVLKAFSSVASEFVFVPLDSERPSRSPEELSKLLDDAGCGGIPRRECAKLSEALAKPPPPGRRRLICGSLKLCGEALSALGREQDALASL